MKTIIVKIKKTEENLIAVVYPLSSLESVERHYHEDNATQFDAFIKSMFGHRGEVVSYEIYDELQLFI